MKHTVGDDPIRIFEVDPPFSCNLYRTGQDASDYA
jgi:hypothetical protein